MNLIDADELMKEFAEFVKESNNSDFADVPTWNDAVSLLGSAPTVEAITVDWLKKLQVRYLEADCNMSVGVVNEIVTLWRKENDNQERPV